MRATARSIAGAWLLTAAASATTQGGYTAEQHADLGLSFSVPRSYEPVPTQADEPWIVLQYAEKLAEEQASRKKIRPGLEILWIDRGPDPAPPAADAGADAGRRLLAALGPKPLVNSIDRYVMLRHRGWKLGPAVAATERDGYRSREHILARSDGGASPLGLWVYAWEGEQRTIVVLGSCAGAELKEQVDLWRYTAERMQIREPSDSELETLQRRYAGTRLSGTAFRIETRRKLGRGWRAEDTEHYIVVHDTADQPLIRKVCSDLEVLRLEFAKLFPPADGETAVARVRICKDRDEYLAYGGNPSAAGHWRVAGQELVLYDARQERKGAVADDSDTFVVLYHEAFHQFVHHSVGDLPPHPWFNEGHGDYFSGFSVRGGQVLGIGPNPWRVAAIKNAIERREWIPWKDIVRYEQGAFMKHPHLAYAQAWSMVWFLRRSPEVARRPEWARILPTYFEALKVAWAEERAKIAAAKLDKDRHALAQASQSARSRAADAAFEELDWAEIENAWLEFVRGIEAPKGG